MEAYDNHADELFYYCYEKSLNREVAKEQVEKIFRKTWMRMAEKGEIGEIKPLLYAFADELSNESKRKISVRAIAQRCHKIVISLYFKVHSKI